MLPVRPVGGLLSFLLVICHTDREVVEHRSRGQREHIADLEGAQLDRDERNKPLEQADHVEESAGDVLSDNHRDMLVLRVSAALQVPVLDGSDDMSLVGRTQLNLDLIPGRRLRLGQEQVQPTCPGLPPLHISYGEVAKAEQARVRDDPLLRPLLAEGGVPLEAHGLRALVVDHAVTAATDSRPMRSVGVEGSADHYCRCSVTRAAGAATPGCLQLRGSRTLGRRGHGDRIS